MNPGVGECSDISLNENICRNSTTMVCVSMDISVNCRDSTTNNCQSHQTFPLCLNKSQRNECLEILSNDNFCSDNQNVCTNLVSTLKLC